MRHSRVLTIVTLAVLSSLSFVHAQNVVDTPHRRAIQHLRLRASSSPDLSPTPSSSPAPSQSPDVNTQPKVIPTSLPSSSSSTPTSSLSPSSSDSSSSVQPSSSSQPSDTTSSTPNPTSSQPSSTPSSTTSSSNPSSSPSSSSSSNSATTPVQANVPNRVSTTFVVSSSPVSNNGFSLSPDGGSTVFASPTAGAVSKGFFANKAAVAATFSIIGIICGLAAIIGAVTMIKRYRRSRDDDDEFYEKYPGASGTSHSRFSRDIGTHGTLGASATDLSIDAAPPEAYPDRQVHYGQPNPNTVFRPVDYGIDYPPQAANAAAASSANRGNSTDIAYEAYEQYEYDPNRRSTSAGSHPFADPANAPRTAAAPPVSYPRNVQGRVQEMVNVDSYYGPNSAGVGASAGYAQ